jgi:sulfur relay (sulfurtransferase) complex TusBCD TusD component (DsrE family)
MNARGLSIEMMISGTERSSMEELAQLSIEAEKVFVF